MPKWSIFQFVLLNLLSKYLTRLKRHTEDNPSSLFGLFFSLVENKVYNIDIYTSSNKIILFVTDEGAN